MAANPNFQLMLVILLPHGRSIYIEIMAHSVKWFNYKITICKIYLSLGHKVTALAHQCNGLQQVALNEPKSIMSRSVITNVKIQVCLELGLQVISLLKLEYYPGENLV